MLIHGLINKKECFISAEKTTKNNNLLEIYFSGKIYNLQSLMSELNSSTKTTTIEEILKELYLADNVNLFKRLEGKWIIVIYDSAKQELILARDPLASIPLYFYLKEDCLFSDELAFFHRNKTLRVNERYFADLYIDSQSAMALSDQTIYKEVLRINGGEYLILNIQNKSLKRVRFYQFNPEISTAKNSLQKNALKFNNWLEKIIDEQYKTTNIRQTAVLMSGGIDSTGLAALLKKRNDSLRALSIVFPNFFKNEYESIEMVRKHLNIDVIYLSESAIDLYFNQTSEIIKALEHPFFEPNIYWLWHTFSQAKTNKIESICAGYGIEAIVENFSKYEVFTYLNHLIYRFNFLKFINNYRYFRSVDWNIKNIIKAQFYKRFFPYYPYALNPDVFNSYNHCEKFNLFKYKNYYKAQYDDIFYTQAPYYLYILNQYGKTFNIETLSPYIDIRLFEWGFHIPREQKITGNKGKILLREAFKELLPEPILNFKTKIGLEPPPNYYFKTSKNRFFKPMQEQIMESKLWKTNLLDRKKIISNPEKYITFQLFTLSKFYDNMF